MANQVILEFIGDPSGLKPVAEALQNLTSLTEEQTKAFTKANQDFAKNQGEIVKRQKTALDELARKVKQVPEALSGAELVKSADVLRKISGGLSEVGEGAIATGGRVEDLKELLLHLDAGLKGFGDDAIADSVSAVFAQLGKLLRDVAQESEDVKRSVVATFQSVADAGFEIAAERRERQLEEELAGLEERRVKALENEDLTENQKAAINRKFQQQEAQVRKRVFEAEKQAKITQAIINGALAVTNILATIPGGPLNPATIVSIAVAAATTAAQIAVITAQKAPRFARGTKWAPGGFALVGEEGPELVHLPQGTRVITHPETKRLLEGKQIGDILQKYNLPAMERDFPLPVVDPSLSKVVKAQERFRDFDYKKLGAEIAKHPRAVVNVNEKGLEIFLQQGNLERQLLNKRYSA